MQNLSISCALVALIILGSAALTGAFGVCQRQISAILVTGVMYLLAGELFIVHVKRCASWRWISLFLPALFALFTLMIIHFKRTKGKLELDTDYSSLDGTVDGQCENQNFWKLLIEILQSTSNKLMLSILFRTCSHQRISTNGTKPIGCENVHNFLVLGLRMGRSCFCCDSIDFLDIFVENYEVQFIFTISDLKRLKTWKHFFLYTNCIHYVVLNNFVCAYTLQETWNKSFKCAIFKKVF